MNILIIYIDVTIIEMPIKRLKKLPEVFKDHRIAQIWGVKDLNLLSDEGLLVDKLLKIAKLLKLTVVNTFVHKFEPQGVSAVLVIAESHMAVHTWPEQVYLHIDLFTCSPKTHVKLLKQVLKKEFPALKVKVTKIDYREKI